MGLSTMLKLFSSLIFVLLLLVACETPKAPLVTNNYTCEYRVNPLGIDVLQPRLGWQVTSPDRGAKQTAYQILVASNRELLSADQGDLWDTGKVASDITTQIPYRGKPLGSEQECYWKVRVWNSEDLTGQWSDIQLWTMGLLDQNEWKAGWIGFDDGENDGRYPVKEWGNDFKRKGEYRPLPAKLLRNNFEVRKPVKRATLYITALGTFMFYVNGSRVSDDYFAPGYTDYRKRLYYMTYDVSDLLKDSTNAASAELADGWYAGNVANYGQYYYGKHPRLRAQMHITYQDGSRDTVITSSEWKTVFGPVREADMQGGETFDARMQRSDWRLSSFNDSSWAKVDTSADINVNLHAYPSIPVRRQVELPPQGITRLAPGYFIVDMGQNFAGWAKVTMQGPPGLKLELSFAEMLNSDNTLFTKNLRSARQRDTYILNGRGTEVWEPSFTYHGFRYVELLNYPGKLSADKIRGVVAFSDLEHTGNFICSDSTINSLYQSALWSQRSNFFEIPTDCPQRDERAGWAGDVQVFMKAAAYNMDVAAFMSKWIADLADAQYPDGRMPSTAPRVYGKTASGWGDAIVIVPWQLYQSYGDTRILEKHYDDMQAWTNYLESKSKDGISSLWSFGDWQHYDDSTTTRLFSTAYYAHSIDLMGRIAEVLGKTEDASRYQALHGTIKTAFQDQFILSSGLLSGNSQTAYVMALAFDLLSDARKKRAASNLLNRIKVEKNTITTGMHGSAYILPALANNGQLEKAYEMLTSKEFPSWGFQLTRGATTPWERWDGYLGNGKFNDDPTNSFNHFGFGAYTEWFYSAIAGIKPLEPGYKKILIAPRPGGDLTFANGEYKSIHGKIVSSWELNDNRFQLRVEIPANTSATVILPFNKPETAITESGHDVEDAEGVTFLKAGNDELHYEVLSGSYLFEVALK